MSVHPSLIAVIDDDERMCQALGRLLRVAGYAVRTYRSAEAFLRDPEREGVDFVVADIQLGAMTGFDLLERLRVEQPGLRVALITAHDDSDVRTRAGASGCAVYLRKPFPSRALLDVIQRADAAPTLVA